MAERDFETVVIGGGAAGIAAARRLHQAGVNCVIIEARLRLGGRGWTVADAAGHALDLGCGWLHSADRNPWVAVAEEQKRTIDKTRPPWARWALPHKFPEDEQREFRSAQEDFFRRVGERAQRDPDVAAAALLAPGCRWNGLISAIGTYISGAELDRVSARDFDNYDDTNVNWRVVEGYGATIAKYGEDLPAILDCPVQRIDHRGKRLRIEIPRGAIVADQAIVTLPTSILANAEQLFMPALPDKTEAARGLPLGLADKLFLSLEGAEEFDKDSRLFGSIDKSATATYHMRSFGRPLIEAYFGGRLAAELEAGGPSAFFEFAVSELTRQLGNDFARRVKPIHNYCWGTDPFARGSYSYALPGKTDCRATLAAPVDGRLFFAGEACSHGDFSTAHGGWITGVLAADQAISALRKKATKPAE